MSGTPFTIEQTLTLLTAVPVRLAEFSAKLTPAQLRQPPEPDAWSAVDILAHLRACSDMWGGSIMTMLAQDQPNIRAINPVTWIKRTNYPELAFAESLQAYTEQRTELLAVLKSLPEDSWQRTGIFTGAGAPITRSVSGQAQRLARHERSHIKQFNQIAAAFRNKSGRV